MASTSSSLAEPFFGLLCKLWISCSSASVLWNMWQIIGCSMSWSMLSILWLYWLSGAVLLLTKNVNLENWKTCVLMSYFITTLRYQYFAKNRVHSLFFHDVPPAWPVELKITVCQNLILLIISNLSWLFNSTQFWNDYSILTG